MSTFKYDGYNCKFEIGEYASNDNTAITLIDADDGQPVTSVTVNFDEKLPADTAYIKNYSENEGLLEILMTAKIVTEVVGQKISGFIVAPKVILNMDLINQMSI